MRRPATTQAMQQPGRMMLVGLMLLAFLFQGYATQTHIHPQDFAAPIAVKNAGAPGQNKLPPGGDDPARCPVCQQIAQAGHYLAPAWALPILVLQTVSTVETSVFAALHDGDASHNWRSRGPPRL